MYDQHETNASRRFKALGSFWSDLCRGKDSKTPKTASDGTQWPPCHNLGVAYSSDGITFDHAQNEGSHDPGNVAGLDAVGQNDGALDLAMWDEDLGAYWGLVRVDVVGPPEPMPWGGAQGFRRTGRFTTKDFRSFSPAQQVFHGRQGYEICKSHRPSVFQRV